MNNLWSANHPRTFWQVRPDPPDEVWQQAIQRSLPLLGLDIVSADIDEILEMTLGESRFGPDHWEMGVPKRLYYVLKPLIPRAITRQMRKAYSPHKADSNGWPIESRYVTFLWDVLRQVMLLTGCQDLQIKPLWPHSCRFSLVLTHDIETATGQAFVPMVADLEEQLGFHSLFNFIPERYPLDHDLMADLRRRGFEVGVHGLKHDGRLFTSRNSFMHKAERINRYLKDWPADGFRAELTHRQPEWMQALDIRYDLSFFDTDPYEPIPGGTMSIWPFFLGRFIELPYTLVQDYTLASVLGETSPQLWLEKVEFISQNHGMALINTHPDYLQHKPCWKIYEQFLNEMKKRALCWHALPGEVAGWWRSRASVAPEMKLEQQDRSVATFEGESLKIAL